MKRYVFRFVLLLMWLTPQVRAQSEVTHLDLFRNFEPTEWQQHHKDVPIWFRRVYHEGTPVILRILIYGDDVVVRATLACENSKELDVIWWRAGDAIGIRDDCTNTRAFAAIPRSLEDSAGELPTPVRRAILDRERRANTRRTFRILINI